MKYKHSIIVGIFIFLGLMILFVTIFTLGGQKKTFVKSITISAVFDDVGGLLPGANIWLSGLKIGTVKKISFFGASRIQVTMSIEKQAQGHIHIDSKARIGSDGLIGNKIVIISGGDSSLSIVQKNDFIQAEKVVSSDDIMTTLQANNLNLLAVTRSFKNIGKKLDSGRGTIASLIGDAAMAQNLSSSIENLKGTMLNFKNVSAKGVSTITDLEAFSHKLNNDGSSLNRVLQDSNLYVSIRNSLMQLQAATESISRFTLSLSKAGDNLNDRDNIVSMLLKDSAATHRLQLTLENLEKGSVNLNEDLEAVQHNFLLRNFFRKKEKAKLDSLAVPK